MNFITIYTTNPDRKTAQQIADLLLKKKLIACANFFPIESSYWWRGKLIKDKEVVSLLKTKKSNWLKVKKEIEKIHPYQIPCIMKFPVTANAAYSKWINQESK